MITIGEAPWSYIGLLNECLRMLLTVLLGVILAHCEIFDATEFVPQIVKFVFRVALPMHIMRGIGIAVDFYSPLFQWNYIVTFLVLRAVALAASFGWVLTSTCRRDKNSGIGQVAVLWLMLSWISSVILGVPISQAVFGSEQLGLFYGLVRSKLPFDQLGETLRSTMFVLASSFFALLHSWPECRPSSFNCPFSSCFWNAIVWKKTTFSCNGGWHNPTSPTAAKRATAQNGGSRPLAAISSARRVKRHRRVSKKVL